MEHEGQEISGLGPSFREAEESPAQVIVHSSWQTGHPAGSRFIERASAEPVRIGIRSIHPTTLLQKPGTEGYAVGDESITQMIRRATEQRMGEARQGIEGSLDSARVRQQIREQLFSTLTILTSPDSLERSAIAFQQAAGRNGAITDLDRRAALAVLGGGFGGISAPCELCHGQGTYSFGPWGSRKPTVNCSCERVSLTLTEEESLRAV